MNISLRQLLYFKALAEQRNFGRAAAVVHVSQPALSVQIREMEAALGGALVERQARDVVLTPFGRIILAHAEKVLDEMQALKEAARWKQGLSGQLRLGIIPTIAPYILPGALAELRARDISLDVQVQEGKTARLLQALAVGELDAAVVALPSGGPDVVERPLFEDRFLLAGSPQRLASIGTRLESLRPDEIGATQLLLLEDGHCLTDQALEVCHRDRSAAQINMGASSLATLSRLVAAGFGLTLLPELAVREEAEDLALHRFAAPEPFRTIGLIRRSSSPDDGWFTELGDILAKVGDGLVQEVRCGGTAPEAA